MKWALEPLAEPFETNSSWLQSVRHEGRRAFLKLAKPASDERPGIALLAWFDGQGAVEVLRTDADAVLMAEANERPSLSRLEDFSDEAAFEILVETADALHHPRSKPMPDGLVPLTKVRDHVFTLPPVQEPRFNRWRDFALGLDLMGENPVPLHGDIHHDNVIWEPGRSQWVVIDPKGYFGHPAYDFANLFFNPMDQASRVADKARMSALADLVAARAVGVEGRQQVLDFAFLYGGMSTIWGYEDDWAVDRFIQLAMLEDLWAEGTDI